MTGHPILDLVVSLAGIAFLLVVSWLLGGWKSAAVTEEAARARLAFDEPDFRVSALFCSKDERTALALSDDDDVALIFSAGDGLATRRLPKRLLQAARDKTHPDRIIVRTGDISRPAIAIVAGSPQEAAAWLGCVGGGG